MKLEPGERSILARFRAGPNAEAAVAALKAAGFADAGMDRIGQFGYTPDLDRQRPAIAGAETSLANTVLHPEQLDDDSRVLLAAFPESSGMGGPITADDPPFLVTVVTSDDLIPQAADIITRHGGEV